MTDIEQLKQKHLIDKEQFVNRLVEARSVVNGICSVNHPDDDFEHPIVNIINVMIRLIQDQEEVKIV